MSSSPADKLKHLQLNNFTCFSKAEFEFSEGVNVFIGENGTGKTHLLKLIFAIACERGQSVTKRRSGEHFGYFLEEIFKVEDGQLIRTSRIEDKNECEIILDTQRFYIRSNDDRVSDIKDYYGGPTQKTVKCLYLPPQEMLSWQDGFTSLYKDREVAFDRTYYELANALGRKPFKNEALQQARKLIGDLEAAINAKIEKENGKFYLKFKGEKNRHEATVVAQGINKIAQIIYLIENGSLDQNTILLWDEPEANLNPKYIRIIATFIQTLANAGVQIFIATHNYLLSHQLSLAAEYKTAATAVPDMCFFSLYKGENGTLVESAGTLAQIENNAILDEYAAFYDLEQLLFKKSTDEK